MTVKDMPGDEFSRHHTTKHFQRYLDFAVSIVSRYVAVEPFHIYLKKYFSFNKKHGSKDRKQIAALCYNYFRLGYGVISSVNLQDKLLLGIFLCESTPSSILEQLKPQWNEKIDFKLSDKLKSVENDFDLKNIFPFSSELSDKIDPARFTISFLKQPRLFVRIRPGKEQAVLDRLKGADLVFEKINNNCLVFSHNEKVTTLLKIDKDVVIQDYNSQRVGEFLPKNIVDSHLPVAVWDCCAGSGGKSILVVDILKNIRLTATDKRPSILQNLKRRFAAAGIKKFNSFVLDVASNGPLPVAETFDAIIADVPCTGSGTWSRSPEQIHFFQQTEIERYASLQRNIVKNTVPQLKQRGLLLYITCSVFKKENEDNVDYFQQNFQLKLLKKEYLEGYDMYADTLFVAAFVGTG